VRTKPIAWTLQGIGSVVAVAANIAVMQGVGIPA
jgi:hypothetical protein